MVTSNRLVCTRCWIEHPINTCLFLFILHLIPLQVLIMSQAVIVWTMISIHLFFLSFLFEGPVSLHNLLLARTVCGTNAAVRLPALTLLLSVNHRGVLQSQGTWAPVAPPQCIIEVSLVSPAEPARSSVRSVEGLKYTTAGPCFPGAWTCVWPCVCGLRR